MTQDEERDQAIRTGDGLVAVYRHTNKWRRRMSINDARLTLGKYVSDQLQHELGKLTNGQTQALCKVLEQFEFEGGNPVLCALAAHVIHEDIRDERSLPYDPLFGILPKHKDFVPPASE